MLQAASNTTLAGTHAGKRVVTRGEAGTQREKTLRISRFSLGCNACLSEVRWLPTDAWEKP